MTTAQKVAERKQRKPERYCPKAGCLWMTGGGYCPRHEAPQHTPTRAAASDAALSPSEAEKSFETHRENTAVGGE